MTVQIVVTGTDTGIGKTVFAAGLTGMLDGIYWKPVQSGTCEETDREVVSLLAGLSGDRVLPEAWRLHRPLSPTAPLSWTAWKSMHRHSRCPPPIGRLWWKAPAG